MKSVVLVSFLILAASAVAENFFSNAVVKVRAVEHGDAVIPCGQSKIFLDGPEAFVSWRKDDKRVVYRFPINNSNTDERSFNDICYRSPDIRPCRERTSLFLPRVTKDDAGFYRCRIHYNASPVVDYDFDLTIVDPPGEPKIFIKNIFATSIEKKSIGPFQMGDNLTLLCKCDDARENIVHWEHDGQIITDPKIVRPGLRSAELDLYSLQRDHHGARYACIVQAADVTPPLVKEIVITMYLPPLSMYIDMDEEKELEVGYPKVIDCIVTGFIPVPTINWYLDNTLLKTDTFQESPEHNVTLSTLTIIPELSDDNRMLSCRASNKYFNKVYKSEVKLRVGFKPKCVVKSKRRIVIKPNVEEKVVCIVDSYPRPIAFTWNFPNNKIVATPVQDTEIPTRFMSTLSWIPHSDDIGKLNCKATNYHGEQEDPCYFDIGPECANERGDKVPCKSGQSDDSSREMITEKNGAELEENIIGTIQTTSIDVGSDIIEMNVEKSEDKGPRWGFMFLLGSSFLLCLFIYIVVQWIITQFKKSGCELNSNQSSDLEVGATSTSLQCNEQCSYWREADVVESSNHRTLPPASHPIATTCGDLRLYNKDWTPGTTTYCV